MKGYNKAFSFLIILQSIIYGLGDPVAKAAFAVIPVYSLLSIRYTAAFLIFWLLGRKKICEELKQYPVRLWLIPGLCIAGGYLLNNLALQMTAATSAAFLRSLSIVLTPMLAFFVYKARYHWIHIPIQGILLIGVYLLCGAGGLTRFGAGEILALGSAVLGACALVFSGTALKEMSPMTISTVQAGCAAVMVMTGALVFDGGIICPGMDFGIWCSILYLSLVCTIGGYLLQNIALTKITSRSVALIQCFSPVMTAAFSYFILNETMNEWGMIGALIILICIVTDTLLK